MTVDPEVSILKTNHLKARLVLAEKRATLALDNLGAQWTNPVQAQLTVLEDAWQADTTTRTNFLEDLLGAGAGVRSAFIAAEGDFAAEAEAEPAQIDVEAEPDLEWKTDYSRIDGRVGWGY